MAPMAPASKRSTAAPSMPQPSALAPRRPRPAGDAADASWRGGRSAGAERAGCTWQAVGERPRDKCGVCVYIYIYDVYMMYL